MVQSSARTPEEYLAELPEPRREAISTVREVILRSLPEGYVEAMRWGMLSYEIPLERYPDSYNGQPLACVGLAAQKNHLALYLMAVYSDPGELEWLRERFREAGKKLDMGKSCLRFRAVDDLPLESIGELVARTPPERFIQIHEAARGGGGDTRAGAS